MRTKKVALVVLLVAVIGASSCAFAVIKASTMFYTAVNSCQGALPGFAGSLRKGPLALINEGQGTAFVSCGVTTHISILAGVGRVESATIFLRNTGTGPAATVPCTFANDQNLATTGDELFISKSIAIAPNQVSTITWTQSENIGGVPFRLPGISCALPPKTQVEQLKTTFSLDVGA